VLLLFLLLARALLLHYVLLYVQLINTLSFCRAAWHDTLIRQQESLYPAHPLDSSAL
jgi:hypothetical protein